MSARRSCAALALSALAVLAPAAAARTIPPTGPVQDWTQRREDVWTLLQRRPSRERAFELPATTPELRAIVEAFSALDPRDDFASWAIEEAALELAQRLRQEAGPEAEQVHWLRTAARAAAERGEAGRTDRARAALELSRLSRHGGADAQAREELEGALAGLDEADGIRPFVLFALADLAQYQLEWERADELLVEAEASLQEIPQHEAIRASIAGLRGQVYLGMGLPDRAAPWIERAVRAADALRERGTTDWGLLLAAHVHRANLRLATDRLERLVDEVEGFLATTDVPASHAAGRGSLLVRLGRAYQELAYADPSKAERARALLTEALEAGDLRAVDRHTAQVRLALLALRAGELDEARARLDAAAPDAAAEPSPIDDAFLAALELRWALAAEHGVTHALGRLDAAYAALLERWAQSPERPGGIGFLSYRRARFVIAELIHGHAVLDGAELAAHAGLRAVFDAQRVGTLARRLGAGDESFERVGERLIPADGGLLVFLPGLERSHVFLWDAGGLRHTEGSGATEIDAARRELARLLSRPPRPEDLEAERREHREGAARLALLVLPEDARARIAGWRAMTVVGDDFLEVPFEALVVDGHELGTSVALASLPSLPVGLVLDRRHAEERDAARLVFVSTAGTERAPGAQAYRGERVDTLSGDDATLERVRGLLEHHPRLVQLFTHGERDPQRERSIALQLAPSTALPDGLLTAPAIEALDVRAELVVAAACSAGAGPSRFGDASTGHLGGALLAAGAHAVVLPTADVALEPTRELLEALHAELASGASPAEALRRARARAAERPALDHPFYTATLQLVGLGHEPLFEARPRPTRLRWILGSAAGAAALFALARTRRRA